jgi:hypothetical protein
MVVEVKIPDDWPPGLGIALAQLLRQTLSTGSPVVVAIRPDASDEELRDAYSMVRGVITEAGLAA